MIGIIDFSPLFILTSTQISITIMSFESWGKAIHTHSFAEDPSYLIFKKQSIQFELIHTSTLNIED